MQRRDGTTRSPGAQPHGPRHPGWRAAAIVGILAWAGAVQAQATYYVSPSGDDGRDGRAPATAWRTVAKVNATPLAPGDRVLFLRGGEWREQLVAGSSGTAGRPIVYGAYGRGPRPKLWGSDVLDRARFRPVGNGAYAIETAKTVNAVWIDHRFLRSAALVTRSPDFATNLAHVKARPNTWYFSGGRLYLNAGTDPQSDRRVYTAGVREDLVFTNQKDHLIIRDLVVDESARFNAGYGFRIFGSAAVRLEACAAYRAGKHHFGVIDSTGFVGKDLDAAHAMPDQGVGGASAYVSYSDRRRAGDTSRYVDCGCEHLEDTGTGGTYPAFVTHGEGIGSVTLDNFVSRGAEVTLGNQESGAAIRINGGRLEDAVLSLYGVKIRVDGMSVVGDRGGVTLAGSENVLQNLRIVGGNPGFAGYQAAITDRGRRNTIRFCTIVMSPRAKSFDAAISLVSPNSRLAWYGNIMLSTGTVVRAWFSGFNPAAYHASYNFYQKGAKFDTRVDHQGSLDSLDQWKSLGLDAGSLEGDPRFADPAHGDYSLLPGSPAIDAAKLDPALRAQVPTDFAGRPRLQGQALDMGAFEAPQGNRTSQSGSLRGPFSPRIRAAR